MEPDFDDLEARIASLYPPVAVPPPDDFEDRLRELDADADPEPEEEEAPQTGRLVISYNRAVIRRDEQGRISEIIEATSRKFIERDLYGTPVAVTEVVETEEVEEPEDS
jgi:hypothetical protein